MTIPKTSKNGVEYTQEEITWLENAAAWAMGIGWVSAIAAAVVCAFVLEDSGCAAVLDAIIGIAVILIAWAITKKARQIFIRHCRSRDQVTVSITEKLWQPIWAYFDNLRLSRFFLTRARFNLQVQH